NYLTNYSSILSTVLFDGYDIHRPVIKALELMKKYTESASHYFADNEEIPIEGVIRPGIKEAVMEKSDNGQERINRINYEIVALQALRDKLRCKEIWVAGASRYRNPDEDLPTDFEERREENYKALKQPLDSEEFISTIKQNMINALTMLDTSMPKNTKVKILTEKNFVDSHGQSEVAFAFCHLLGFNLMPRLKGIHRQKLYRPDTGMMDAYPNLQPVLTRPINWDLIRQQYDQMIKYATALRLGTAETEAIMKRFTRNNLKHPTYLAMAELGKAIKTIFLCEYLKSEELRIEINEGLNVVENWNSANGFIFFGKGGEIATNRIEDQELAVLSLHLVQNCLVYINTLMIQKILSQNKWLELMTPEDLRALTPLIYSHINPYGNFALDMEERILIDYLQ
ncbi:transposase, partial [Pelosinus baikalensis]